MASDVSMFEDPNEDTSDGNLIGYWLEGDSLAPPCQAEMDVVDSIVDFANLTKDSVMFDLGCGDGRICIRATQRFGCRSTGCEIEPSLVAKFRQIISRCGLESLVTAIEGDLRELDLSSATAISIYLLPDAIEGIKPMLTQAVRQGAVVICNTWGPKDWIPQDKKNCGFCDNVSLYKYDVSSLP